LHRFVVTAPPWKSQPSQRAEDGESDVGARNQPPGRPCTFQSRQSHELTQSENVEDEERSTADLEERHQNRRLLLRLEDAASDESNAQSPHEKQQSEHLEKPSDPTHRSSPFCERAVLRPLFL